MVTHDQAANLLPVLVHPCVLHEWQSMYCAAFSER